MLDYSLRTQLFNFLRKWRNLKEIRIHILKKVLTSDFWKQRIYIFLISCFVFSILVWKLVIVPKNNLKWSRLSASSSFPLTIITIKRSFTVKLKFRYLQKTFRLFLILWNSKKYEVIYVRVKNFLSFHNLVTGMAKQSNIFYYSCCISLKTVFLLSDLTHMK